MRAIDLPSSLISLLVLGVLLLPTIVDAETTTDESVIETVVVTASRLDRELGTTTQSVSVLTEADITSRQVPTVTELLRQFAGVNVIQQGARGGVTSMLLRGGEPNFTVVMIDGVRVNDPTNTRGGSYDFSYLDVNNIGRVELVRGPMGAIYGSDGLSGVLNILTRNSGEGGRLRLEAGGFDLLNGSFSFGTNAGRWNLRAEIHGNEESGAIEGASYEDVGGSASVRYNYAENSAVGLSVRYQDADSTSFPEDSGGPELAVIREVDTRAVEESHGRAFIDHVVSNWKLSATASRYNRKELFDSPGIAPGVFDGVPPNSSDTDYTRDAVLASARFAGSDTWGLVFGAEWQGETGISTGVLDFGFPLPTDFRFDRDTRSVFVEGDVALGRVTLLGSVRRDDPDDIDAEVSSQLGVVFSLPGDAGELRFNAGEGFKAPSFFALAHPLVGNPDLVAETARSFDVGYRWDFGPSSNLEFSVFRNEYKNLIDFDPETFSGVNRSSVVSEGAELAISAAVTNTLMLSGHVTYMEVDNEDSDTPLRGRPKWRGGLMADWQFAPKWQLYGGLLALDEFYEASIPTGGIFLDGYARLDIALRYQLTESVQFGFALDNALDADYEEAVGFPAPGRRARLNLTMNF